MTVAPPSPTPFSRPLCGFWALISLLAALYATLLPFEFSDLSWTRAWSIYTSMRYTAPGTQGRQQFMSNLVLFLPLGFFFAGWFGHATARPAAIVATVIGVAGLGLLTTASVELLQVWLPYRYPAGADLLGNFFGALLGAVAWFLLRRRLAAALAVLVQSGPTALRLALAGYAAGYVILGLAPFDLVLSADELAQRIDSTAWGWWTAPTACTVGLECIAGLSIEVLLSVPVGLLIGLWLAGQKRLPLWRGLLLISVLALTLEVANLLTFSGIAEGRSAVTRAIGMAGGLLLTGRLPAHPHALVRRLQQRRTPILALAALPYLLALFAVNLGPGPYPFELSAAAQRLAETRLLPFYYHYHISEAAAIRSVALHLVMYLPVGALVWLAWLDRAPQWSALARRAALTGAGTALSIEASKLLLTGARPDSTSLVLAAGAAAAGAAALHWLIRAGSAPPPAAHSPSPSPGEGGGDPPDLKPFAWHRAGAAVLALLSLGLALTWPIGGDALAVGLLAYAVLLLWQPLAWLLVLPAAIPVLDGSLYTGWLLFGELDLLLLMTVAGAWWHRRRAAWALDLPRVVRWPLTLLVLSTLLALAVALWPLPAWEPGRVALYVTEWNAVRVGKGLLWAVLLLVLLRRAPTPPAEAVRRWFPAGVASGLAATLLLVVRERATYPGLFDFTHTYRISGWFTDMQVGGPSIETFLVLALPVALLACWQRPTRWAGPATWVLALGTVYAVATTYSRGGYLGLAAVVAILLSVGLLSHLRRPSAAGRRTLIATGGLLAALAVVLPTLLGGFAEQRLSQVTQGLEARLAHWQLALELPGAGALSPWIGRGLGQFPQAYRRGYPGGSVPANFAFEEGTLRLGSGDSLYLNQRVALERDATHELTVQARSAGGARLGLYLCEKHVRHSFECVSTVIALPSDTDWTTAQWPLNLRGMDRRPWPLRRELVLSLAHAGGGEGVVEVDHVRLRNPAGQERLRNGDFSARGQNWYFTTDHLWPWRVENQWLEIYLDQGVLGLTAFIWLTIGALWVLLRRALKADALALGSFAGLSGALVVGVFSTLFFSAQIALLFYLLLLLGVVGSTGRASGALPREG